MTDQLYYMLQAWLESDNDIQRAHATHRLSMPDASGFEPSSTRDMVQKSAKPLVVATDSARKYPSLLEQAGNALVATGRAIASGFAHVDQAEQDRRLEICKGDTINPQCELFDSSQGRCSKCACFTRFKTWLATEKCPISKW